MQRQDAGKIAIIPAPGFYRDQTSVIACFDDAASALAYCRRGNVQAIRMPESWTDSEFRVGKTVYADMVGREYSVVNTEAR